MEELQEGQLETNSKRDKQLYFKAVGRLQDLDLGFDIDLVEFHNAYPIFRLRLNKGLNYGSIASLSHIGVAVRHGCIFPAHST